MVRSQFRLVVLGYMCGCVVTFIMVWSYLQVHSGVVRNCGPAVNGDRGYSLPANISEAAALTNTDQRLEAAQKAVRILCWVMTCPSALDQRAIHVKNTWGPRCDVLLFSSDEYNQSFPTINISIKTGRQYLTNKTFATFDYIYQHHFNDADWFLKADDDTYVVVENLRYFLSEQNTSEAIYFGDHFMWQGKDYGFMSGGAGYVISKEALKRFGERHNYNVINCKPDGYAEDLFWAHCMHGLNVTLGDSRDALGRNRFNCFSVMQYVQERELPDWTKTRVGGLYKGFEHISEAAITFHYIHGTEMYAMEYYTYHLKPQLTTKGLLSLNRQSNNDTRQYNR